MKNLLLAKRYIDAYVAQQDMPVIEQRLQELVELVKLLIDQDDLYACIRNPLLSGENKVLLIKKSSDVSEPCIQFLTVLFRRQHYDILPDILDCAVLKLSVITNVLSVNVQSAQVLSEKSKGDICTFLEKTLSQKINVTYSLDPTLLAGFRAVANGFVVEASATHILEQFESSMMTDKRR